MDTLIAHRTDARLVELRQGLHHALASVQSDYIELRQAADWLEHSADLLDPEGKPDRSGAEVKQVLFAYLDDIPRQGQLSPRQSTLRANSNNWSSAGKRSHQSTVHSNFCGIALFPSYWRSAGANRVGQPDGIEIVARANPGPIWLQVRLLWCLRGRVGRRAEQRELKELLAISQQAQDDLRTHSRQLERQITALLQVIAQIGGE